MRYTCAMVVHLATVAGWRFIKLRQHQQSPPYFHGSMPRSAHVGCSEVGDRKSQCSSVKAVHNG
jgi:hypothetical protein